MRIRFSIRGRLFWSLLIAISLLGVVSTLAIYERAKSSINELFDYEMRQLAYSLGMHMSSHPEAAHEPLLRVEHDFVTQIWTQTGNLVASSDGAEGPDKPLLAGFSTWREGKGAWRVFSAPASTYVLQVAQPLPHRQQMAAKLAFDAILPAALILPVAGVIIWLGVGYGLKPLGALTRQLRARKPESLDPMLVERPAVELIPLVGALNSLVLRLSQALQAERQFIADASHELRTPATALRLQVDLLESASSPGDRAEAVRDIKRGVERMQRLIEQILTLARLDPDRTARKEKIDLQQSFDELRHEFAALAAAKNIQLVFNIPVPAAFNGEVMAFRALVRNLLDNAVRYTPEGGIVTVTCERCDGALTVRVADSGPGIPEPIRNEVFARFMRGDSNSEDGTGLGLAIAKRAAERLGADFGLQNRSNGVGLIASVVLPKGADVTLANSL